MKRRMFTWRVFLDRKGARRRPEGPSRSRNRNSCKLPRWRYDRGGDATAVAMRRARGKTRTLNKSAAHGPRLFFACRRWPPLRNNCAVRVPRWNAAVLLEFHIRPAAQINDGRALPATSGPAIGRRVVNRDGPGSGLDLSNCFGPCSGLHTKFVRNDWQFCRQ